MPANHPTFDSPLIIVVHDMKFFTGIYIAANSYFVATTSAVLTYGLSIAFHDTASLATIASNTSCALLTSPGLTCTVHRQHPVGEGDGPGSVTRKPSNTHPPRVT